jgi:hypothetical protein
LLPWARTRAHDGLITSLVDARGFAAIAAFPLWIFRLEQASEWRVKTDIVNEDAGSVVGIVFNLFHKFPQNQFSVSRDTDNKEDSAL